MVESGVGVCSTFLSAVIVATARRDHDGCVSNGQRRMATDLPYDHR